MPLKREPIVNKIIPHLKNFVRPKISVNLPAGNRSAAVVTR
jgi:hypothetical protein